MREACKAWQQQMAKFAQKQDFGAHDLFWNGRLKAPLQCLACRYELKSSAFRDSWKPSRLNGRAWQWKWAICKETSATEQACAINKKQYLKKHGAELAKPEDRSYEARSAQGRANQPEGARPKQPPGRRQSEGHHNADLQRTRRAEQMRGRQAMMADGAGS